MKSFEKKIKQPYLLALIIGLIIALAILIGWLLYQDRQEQLNDYYELWDSCDYFIVVNNIGAGDVADCYSPYAYIRIKEDGRMGRYCFVDDLSSRERGSIYGICDWEKSNLNLTFDISNFYGDKYGYTKLPENLTLIIVYRKSCDFSGQNCKYFKEELYVEDVEW